MKIAVFGNTYQKEKISKLEKIFSILNYYQVELMIDETFYHFLQKKSREKIQISTLIMDDHFDADIALSLGGDGTFLQTAMRVGNKGIPILGINMGRLGFLSDLPYDEIVDIITDLVGEEYHVEERTLLQLTTDSVILNYNNALNEIAVLKQDSSSMITIQAEINGSYLTSYQADGLVIATPTGSTAYSLSVGGPIIVPQSNNIVLTPVAPHSLNARPLVLTDNNEIKLSISSRNNHFLVALDGRSTILNSNTKLTIRKADYKIKVIRRKNRTYYDILREKLMWGADKRN